VPTESLVSEEGGGVSVNDEKKEVLTPGTVTTAS